MALVDDLRQEVVDYARLRLGDGMVDVELDQEHYDMAIDDALREYRQRSSNAVEESYAVLALVPDQQSYILDSNIIDVRQIFRRSVGGQASTSSSTFEPFNAGFMNYYLLHSGRSGGLATYEFWSGYQELTNRMFGGYLNFTWETVTKKLTLVRNIRGEAEADDLEEVIVWLYNYKPDATLLQDHMVNPWIKKYAYAVAKYTLGEARSKFSTIAGPQGGTTLNGDTLKAEAQQEMEVLKEELANFQDGQMPMWFVIG